MCARDVASALRGFLSRSTAATSVPRQPLGLRLVLISDTHGAHRQLSVPDGDVLVHAVDFTRYGRLEDATDFNDWLENLPHRHKVVVLGNHEANAPWAKQAKQLLTNALLLRQSACELTVPSDEGDAAQTLRIFGTDFFWPMETPNPNYSAIPDGTDLLIAHGPAKGHVDGGLGCKELLRHVERVCPRVVCSGHVHGAHGVCIGRGALGDTRFVNAANAKNGHAHMGWDPISLDI